MIFRVLFFIFVYVPFMLIFCPPQYVWAKLKLPYWHLIPRAFHILGAIFVGLALYFADQRDQTMLAVTLFVLVSSGIVSYEKARAEGLGLTCDVGIAERPERLILVLVATGFVGMGAPAELIDGALWLLAALTLVTVVQRLVEVRRQAGLPRA